MDPDADAFLGAAVDSAVEMLKQRAERDFHDRFKKEAAAKVPVLRQKRDDAIWHLYHDQHMTTTAIADALRAALVARGVPEESLGWAGISHDTIRNIAGRESL